MVSRSSTVLLLMMLVAIATTAPTLDDLAPEQEVVVESNSPYTFGYEFGDGQGMVQHRQESSDINGEVKGSYGYSDGNGVYRTVEYIADVNGYRAIIRSNEPGLSDQDSADASFIVEPPPPEVVLQQILPVSSTETVVTEI
ncbi:uncharacterized protein CEXT_410181 [Caerostris extrusa]|uniref:Uncharacterized protein n=1 Tax=Caerostris extrusa TaxID=172846 RepID=A0AAV4TI79_CAEEX|nr:uncharacterized protein CEXT_410181 [Caerostris extrusa]